MSHKLSGKKKYETRIQTITLCVVTFYFKHQITFIVLNFIIYIRVSVFFACLKYNCHIILLTESKLLRCVIIKFSQKNKNTTKTQTQIGSSTYLQRLTFTCQCKYNNGIEWKWKKFKSHTFKSR